jgi:hypothetical protein
MVPIGSQSVPLKPDGQTQTSPEHVPPFLQAQVSQRAPVQTEEEHAHWPFPLMPLLHVP